MDNLSDKEKDFLDLLVSGVKLTESEWEARFGQQELQKLRNNVQLRRMSGDLKLSKEKRKSLINNYKLEQFIEVLPIALEGLVEIAKEGNERNKLEACKYLARPAMVYLEKHGVNIADLEVGLASDDSNDDKLIINFGRPKDASGV